jgi:hypothetical protein
MKTNRMSTWLVATFVLAFSAGCTTYYRIHDPSTGKTYYTVEYDQVREGGVKFVDESTGAEVAIQNSEVKEVDEYEYKRGITGDGSISAADEAGSSDAMPAEDAAKPPASDASGGTEPADDM